MGIGDVALWAFLWLLAGIVLGPLVGAWIASQSRGRPRDDDDE